MGANASVENHHCHAAGRGVGRGRQAGRAERSSAGQAGRQGRAEQSRAEQSKHFVSCCIWFERSADTHAELVVW